MPLPEVSPQTLRLVDREVHRLVDDAHREVTALLRRNRESLDRIAHALLEHETVDERQARDAAFVQAARLAQRSV